MNGLELTDWTGRGVRKDKKESVTFYSNHITCKTLTYTRHSYKLDWFSKSSKAVISYLYFNRKD